jgi:hypothetical protein
LSAAARQSAWTACRKAPTSIAALEKHGLKAGAWSRSSLRLVTHRHIDDAAVEAAVEIIRTVSAVIGTA